jgi:alpha,alpha-trehalose phosphorylase
MLQRHPTNPPSHIYPPDPWRWVELQFNPDCLAQMETLFSTANGYLGIRGVCDEGDPVWQNSTLINGFYETSPITYGEGAYGYAKTAQTIVNVTDSKVIKLYVDDEPFYLPMAHLLKFERALDMRSGTLDREILWETSSGKQVSIRSRRLVSFVHRHLAAVSYEVTILNGDAPVVLSSEMRYEQTLSKSEGDPRLARGFQERVLLPEQHSVQERRILLGHKTRNSGMTIVCGSDHQLETKCSYTYESEVNEDVGKVVFTVDAEAGMPIRLIKYISYHTSDRDSVQELSDRVNRTLDRSLRCGFDDVLKSQRQYLNDFWHRGDVQIEGHPEADQSTESMQQILRFNLFHILQASARSETMGVAAKGLTSQAYEGHYFWDMEIYVLPFLIYTSPQIAKNLLRFRYRMLNQARQRAQEVSQLGALFPWRTINGEEASAYYAAGTAQYHINADVIYALKKYVEVTGDEEFRFKEGAEMLVETARMWFSLGFFSRQKNEQFCINGVTGPDEYNTVVNNNTYTNLMARENLWYAAGTIRTLQEQYPRWFEELVHRTNLDMSEVENWQQAADRMYLPYHEPLGIHLQHDRFLEDEVWDFANTPPEKYPLLLHFHPLVIYRHQVIKQADIVLAMLLLGHEFSEEQKQRNFDYYDPLTTGDSSLSVCIQSIIAAEIGYVKEALEYATYAVLMDLGDVAGNVKDGCHIAAMGGTWMVLIYGFAGLRDDDGRLSFSPRLPKTIQRLRFPLTVRGQRLWIEMNERSVNYLLKEGTELLITHQGKELHLMQGVKVSVDIEPTDEENPSAGQAHTATSS